MRKKLENNEILPLGLPEGIKPEQLRRKLHSVEGRTAEFISNWAGSMPFVYFHVIWFTLWFVINSTNVFSNHVKPFDPFPYGLLTMLVSLEAIFLATFIMINQNRQVLVDTYRELEEEEEQEAEEQEQEELEEDVQDIQKDLDDIKNAIVFIQQKISTHEKNPQTAPEKK
ncbi:MAG: hypothetical protein A2186_00505 [Candidatus Levybacteria bacterium RIFOXYA1_FULL_41_10]|nr:MAG: hypothetical protein UT87_C0010G0032 [Candidatus Levybacteria bacterium GW2011_GWC1_40_19]OGH25625.1 MAG: hypothetical protein A3D82_02090 [Candidatus Levybacteria bacterium RIFCSPHIGHO2_02_FULL_40_29]OGH42177.1 MAG: hypothetical protein A2965_03450 [Candidatus Levybacteria bacterium RIFCSPLOWO2_01_FULL_40_96]OGH50561.1 MAG: hypothetical protein A3J18_00155 [Candidatus Levybacteria bacterium RIFCSPLOWO2_02_FULL_40_18]OGH52899.1 MAG: hypothetical protein A3H20_02570 [Candidatus Levybacte